MKIEFAGKVCIVTGGSEGIGAAIAREVADCGGKVVLFSRDEGEMTAVRDSIRESGGESFFVEVDVTDEAMVEAGIEKVIEKWGRIDFLVANAGTNGKWAPVEEITPKEWRNTLDVNLTGTFLPIHFAVPHMKKDGGGSIVIVSSINGTRTFSNEGASCYASSKAAQFAFGKMLALELARSKIRVNVICPGAIKTAIHEKTEREDLDEVEVPAQYPEGNIPLTGGEMGSPEQVGRLAAFLLSDAADHITGTPVWIDGGQSLLI